jgi:hypothetical protein
MYPPAIREDGSGGKPQGSFQRYRTSTVSAPSGGYLFDVSGFALALGARQLLKLLLGHGFFH